MVAVSSQPFALFSENFEQVTHVKKLQNTHKQNFTHAEMHIIELGSARAIGETLKSMPFSFFELLLALERGILH